MYQLVCIIIISHDHDIIDTITSVSAVVARAFYCSYSFNAPRKAPLSRKRPPPNITFVALLCYRAMPQPNTATAASRVSCHERLCSRGIFDEQQQLTLERRPAHNTHTRIPFSLCHATRHTHTHAPTHARTIAHLDVARALSSLWVDLHGNRARLPRYPSPQQSRLCLPRPCAGHCQRRSGTKRRHRTEPPRRNHEKHTRNPRARHTARRHARHRHLCHADGGLSTHNSKALVVRPWSICTRCACGSDVRLPMCRWVCHSSGLRRSLRSPRPNFIHILCPRDFLTHQTHTHHTPHHKDTKTMV